MLNLISPLFSAVNGIAFPGLGILSPKLSESNMIDPRYPVTVFLSLSMALTVISIASFTFAVVGAIISNPATVHPVAANVSA